MTRLVLAAGIILATSGCAAIEYSPDPDRLVYLAAKDSTYLLWRFEAIGLDELLRARAALEVVHEALSAENEMQLDATLREHLFAQVDRHAAAPERAILKELIAAAIDDLALADGSPLEGSAARTATLVIGGILDGITHVEWASQGGEN